VRQRNRKPLLGWSRFSPLPLRRIQLVAHHRLLHLLFDCSAYLTWRI
jgi:hypothetical protein